MCFLRYLQEMDEHPDTYFRYSLYGYLDTAVKKVCEFLGTSPDDTFLIQNATKGIWFFFSQLNTKSVAWVLILQFNFY